MKQKITIVAENNKTLEEVLGKCKLTKEKFDELTSNSWEYMLKSIISVTDNKNGDKIVSVNAETLE